MNAPLHHNPVIWTEIPVANLDKAKAFFEAVLETSLIRQEMGPNVTMVFPYDGERGVAGHLYEGKPAAAGSGPTVHFQVHGTVEDAMARVTEAGGTVVSPVIEIPDGRFAYCTDPDGNSIGLFTFKS
ncbi:MAG: VOC family protein [Notoacmeibacter sp.]|nr:VOC family protein [Notoacmeibacter sp.]MCC0032761.1 VOC family protein [Brucellaceae bacterium]